MALTHRRPAAGLIHCTNRSPQCSAHRYREQLAAAGIRPSVSGLTSAHDHPVAEDFFSMLKNELVHHSDFATCGEGQAAIFDYVERLYN